MEKEIQIKNYEYQSSIQEEPFPGPAEAEYTVENVDNVDVIDEPDDNDLQSILWWKKTAIIITISFFLQLFGVILALILIWCLLLSCASLKIRSNSFTSESVSYTHLDVYKRQVLLDEDWDFYSNDILNDTRIMYSKILGGGDYIEDGNLNGGDIVMGNDQDPTSFSTQMDLHDKLREKLIEKSRQEVDEKNEKNGVIILPAGP